MNNGRIAAVAIVGFWVCGVLQASLAARVQILGAKPDFLLILLGILSMYVRPGGGALVGFFSGLVQGALALANIVHYVISRTIAGFLTAWLNDLEYQPNFVVAAVITSLVTLVSQLLLLLFAPPPSIGGFLGDTIRTALYNGVLAMAAYALLKRVLPSSSR